MMSNGGQSSSEQLKLQLSDQERGFYSNIYNQVNPEGKGQLASQSVVQFMMTSGLEIQQLKQVWATAARTSNDFLVREEFYIALRLVAYMQNNMPANENSIKMNLVAPLPRFDDFNRGTPGAGPAPPAPPNNPQ